MGWQITGIEIAGDHTRGLLRADKSVLSIPAIYEVELGTEIEIEGVSYEVIALDLDKRGERMDLVLNPIVEIVPEETSEDEQTTRRNERKARGKRVQGEGDA